MVPYTAEIGTDTKFAYEGMECVVYSRACIGERAMDVEDNCIVVGVLAKVIRTVNVPIWDLLKNIKFKSIYELGAE